MPVAKDHDTLGSHRFKRRLLVGKARSRHLKLASVTQEKRQPLHRICEGPLTCQLVHAPTLLDPIVVEEVAARAELLPLPTGAEIEIEV